MCLLQELQHTIGTFVPTAVRTGMMPPHFVTPTEHDRKETTTLRQQIFRVASVQPSISPTSSPPKGATKLQRYYPLEIGIRLSEPGRVTAFRDTPPSRANRRSFVIFLGLATVGQTRAFCPEYMGTCMGPQACQARRLASRVLSPPPACTLPLSWQGVHGEGSRTKGRQRRADSPPVTLAPVPCHRWS